MKTLVVHGGPGLDSSYLKPWLERLGGFVFYDQIGCGRDTTPPERVTMERTMAQFAEMVRALSAKEAIAVLAHSWGSHVVLSALKAMPELAKRIARLVLVNPSPLTSARHRAAAERLRARLPPHARNEIEALFADGSDAAGAELMRLALPYYTADAAHPPAMQFQYRIPVYRALLPALNDYDLRKVKRGKIVLSIIRGEQDYLLPSDTAELDAPGVVSIILPGIGHFPFAENPTLFSQTLRQLRE